jgi:hypothetical protein
MDMASTKVIQPLYFSTPYLQYKHGGRANFRGGCNSRGDPKSVLQNTCKMLGSFYQGSGIYFRTTLREPAISRPTGFLATE